MNETLNSMRGQEKDFEKYMRMMMRKSQPRNTGGSVSPDLGR